MWTTEQDLASNKNTKGQRGKGSLCRLVASIGSVTVIPLLTKVWNSSVGLRRAAPVNSSAPDNLALLFSFLLKHLKYQHVGSQISLHGVPSYTESIRELRKRPSVCEKVLLRGALPKAHLGKTRRVFSAMAFGP